MSGNNDNGGGDSPTLRVGDVEKEREIERRLRELGLWENKRLLESRVTSMLEARIEEKDALSRTLRNCRRKRSSTGGTGAQVGAGGRTAIDEIRSIISPRVIRDRYGQRLAYHVDVLMGCFTRDVRHDLVDGVVVISGSTAADDDPARLTKEIRLELPADDLDMAALRVSYAAGAVKIRVPYVAEELPKSRSVSNDGGDSSSRQQKFSSISPLYSLSMQLKNRRKLGSGSSEGGGRGEGGGDDSPIVDHSSIIVNGASTGTVSNLSPGSVNSETRSLSDELQPPSPYPVFEEEQEEEEDGRTLHDNCESRIDIPANNSFRESFDSRVNTTPRKSTEENSYNGDCRVKYDDAGYSDSVLQCLGRCLSPLPSSENHNFDQPGDANDLATSLAEYRGNGTLNKSSRSRSKVDSTGNNNCKNSVLSKSNFRTSGFDEETSNTLRDYKAEAYRPSSSRTTLNSEIADEIFETSGPCRTADGFVVIDSKSNKASNVRKRKDSSLESNGRDSGLFSPNGTRSFADENCSDQDAVATESDFLDSDRSSTSHDRQSVSARNNNNNSMSENELTATTGRNNRVSNAAEGTFSNNNRIRISPSDIRDASGLILNATEAANGVVTDNITFEEKKLAKLTKNGKNQPSTAPSPSSDIGVSSLQKRRSGEAVIKSADDAMRPIADDRSSRAPSAEEDHDHERSASVYAGGRRLTSPFHDSPVAPKRSMLLVDIPTPALMSEWNVVGSSAINESNIGSVNGTTPLRDGDKNVKERPFKMPEINIGPSAKRNGEEAGGKDNSRCFQVKSNSDDKYASGRHQRPSEGRVKVIDSAAGNQSLNGERHHQSTAGQVEGAVGSISNRTRAKRSRANLNLILDSLDETFL